MLIVLEDIYAVSFLHGKCRLRRQDMRSIQRQVSVKDKIEKHGESTARLLRFDEAL